MKELAGLWLFLLGVITGITCRRLLLETAAVDMLYYQLLRVPAPPLASAVLWWGLPGGVLLSFAGHLSGRTLALAKALAPLGLLGVLWFCYPAFWVLPAGIAVVGWSVLRLGSAGFFNLLKLPSISFRQTQWSTLLLYVAAVAWGFFMQYHCRETLFLLHSDWGEYFDGYFNIIYGESGKATGLLAVAGHWNPLPTVIMTLLLTAAPLPETLFAANALAVYSAVPLLYVLARKNNWTPGCALWAAAAGFLSPTLSNQCLSLFYGFHPIVFFIPLMIGFFIFRSSGNRRGMAAMFLLSLLVQETVMIFWAGYALTLLLKRQWRAGLILFAAMAVLFWVISQLAIPVLFGTAGYNQGFHFAELGSSPFEIVLSPLLRPGIFFGALFKVDNFYLLMTLLAPCFLLALRRPDILLAGGPLLCGLFLRNGNGGVNVVVQYALEAGLLVLIASILAGKDPAPGKWRRYLCRGSIGGGRRGWRRGLAAASIATLLLGHYAFAKAPWFGKYSFRPLWLLPSHSEVMNRLLAGLAPGETVAATQRPRAWLTGKCHTVDHRKLASANPECAVLFLGDKSASAEEIQSYRRELHANGYHPVFSQNSSGSQILLFRRNVEGVAPTFLRTISEPDFSGIGHELRSPLPGFAIRFLPIAQSSKWTFLIKPLDRQIFDVMITVTLDFKGQPRIWRGYYAHGVIPAALAAPDQVFILELPRDPDLGFPTSVTVTLTP